MRLAGTSAVVLGALLLCAGTHARFEGVTPRTAPFWPSDVPGLQLWLDANTGVTKNGSTISAWADRSGNGNNAVQATQANQPTYTASGQNGLPVATFAPTNKMAGPIVCCVSNQAYVVAVVNITSGGAGDAVLDTTDTGATNRNFMLFAESGQWKWRVLTPLTDTLDGSVFPSGWVLRSATHTEFLHTFRQNGVQTASTTADVTLTGATQYQIGSLFVSIYAMTGSIGEVLIYTTLPTNAQIAQIEEYLRRKWALY